MTLIIDAGNTNIKLGIFKGNTCKKFISIKKEEIIKANLSTFFKNNKITKSYLGSVVPSYNDKISLVIKKYLNLETTVISNQMFINDIDIGKVDINIIGTDILGYAYYLQQTYQRAVGFSFGTATFAVLIDKKKLVGSIIAPSIECGIIGLGKKTELVETTSFIKTKQKTFDGFGTTTNQAMISGANHMANGFITSVVKHAYEKYKIDQMSIAGGKIFNLKINKSLKPNIEHNAVLIGYALLVNKK